MPAGVKHDARNAGAEAADCHGHMGSVEKGDTAGDPSPRIPFCTNPVETAGCRTCDYGKAQPRKACKGFELSSTARS